jgi:ABC-type branched-chain amino acid transport systems, ATPase component
MPLLELQSVSLSFGGLKVVDSLDMQVEEGTIVSVIGPNGAGKTTLFNLITGIYDPEKATSGSTAGASRACSLTRSPRAASRARSRRSACS